MPRGATSWAAPSRARVWQLTMHPGGVVVKGILSREELERLVLRLARRGYHGLSYKRRTEHDGTMRITAHFGRA